MYLLQLGLRGQTWQEHKTLTPVPTYAIDMQKLQTKVITQTLDEKYVADSSFRSPLELIALYKQQGFRIKLKTEIFMLCWNLIHC